MQIAESSTDILREIKRRMTPLIPPREDWTPPDEALYGPDDLFNVKADVAERLRLKAIRYAFKFHFDHTRFYRDLCRERGVDPESVSRATDLTDVPLMRDTIFKGCARPQVLIDWARSISSDTIKYPALDAKGLSYEAIFEYLEKHGIYVGFSSGTSGTFTIVPRSERCWNRLKYAFSAAPFQIFQRAFRAQISSGNQIIVLGPDPTTTYMMFARASAVGPMVFPESGNYYALKRKMSMDMIRISQGNVSNLRERLLAKFIRRASARMAEQMNSEVLNLLKTSLDKGTVTLTGAPFWVKGLLGRMETEMTNASYGERLFITTGGGWKIREHERIPEGDLRSKANRTLGVPDENIRDVYGMAECGVDFPSCEGHYKHIPHSVVQCYVLDDNLAPKGYGEHGRFAFIDPTNLTFPGFIITGDRVKLLEECPGCDRPGPVMDMEITRLASAGDRGCAYVMGGVVGESLRSQEN